jgi:sigma-B regulation protein RsbU (phosphoserine phosphatase)
MPSGDRAISNEAEDLQAEVERLESEIQRLESEVGRLAADLDAERRRLRDELAFAHRVQLNLMPAFLPRIEGWEIATVYRPAREVGGDFFDVYRLPQRPSTVGFVVADVTGKGVTAALMMAFTRAVLRAAAYNARGPADALRRTNRVLVREARTGLFVTVLIGFLDTLSGSLRWASAGHEPPFVIRSEGRRVSRLRAAGEMLGAFDRLSVVDRTTTIRALDVLVAYTDGVTDARRTDGEFFGERRLEALLRGNRGASAGTVARAIDKAVLDFTGDAAAMDDVTLLAICRAGSGASS